MGRGRLLVRRHGKEQREEIGKICQRCAVRYKLGLGEKFWWSPWRCTWKMQPVQVFIVEIGSSGKEEPYEGNDEYFVSSRSSKWIGENWKSMMVMVTPCYPLSSIRMAKDRSGPKIVCIRLI